MHDSIYNMTSPTWQFYDEKGIPYCEITSRGSHTSFGGSMDEACVELKWTDGQVSKWGCEGGALRDGWEQDRHMGVPRPSPPSTGVVGAETRVTGG